MADGHRLGSLRLIRRSLAHRRAQTLFIILVSACICGTVVFASGYQQQSQQAIVDAAFGGGGAGTGWTLTGPPKADLAALLPAGSQRLMEPAVPGRTAEVSWSSPRYRKTIIGTLVWRADVCRHLVLASGRCPTGTSEVAVSAVDAAAYGVRIGDRLRQQVSLGKPVRFRVVGVFGAQDGDDPFWFDNPPSGRSHVDPSTEKAYADPLIGVRDQFEALDHFETLELRVNRATLRTADLDELAADTAALGAAATRGQSRLTSQVPATIALVDQERGRVVTGLALTLTQLGVLVLVVLALLASVALAASRPELGLSRLRGERRRALLGLVVGSWAVEITIGWVLGWIPGVALLAVVADRLPGQHGLPVGVTLLVAPVLTLVVLVAVMVPGARSMLAQPVIQLLGAAPPAVRETRLRQQLVDATLVVLAVCGLLVAAQAGTSSVLGLLVPSLLAIGLSVLLIRGLVGLAGRHRRRLLRRGQSRGLLAAIMLFRLRGLRIMVVATCLAAAFAVFAVELRVIGAGVRRHVAEVSTGAAAVLEVDATPAAVLRTLDRLDPQHAGAGAELTAVVITRRPDPTALRGMFVEPAGFARVAYGADRTADAAGWARIAASAVEPVTFTGDAVTLTTGAHPSLSRTGGNAMSPDDPVVNGTRAEVRIDYLTSDGVRRTRTLGRLPLAAGGAVRFRQPVECQAGCRLLRITLAPDGPMGGTLTVTSFAAESSGREQAVDLGPAERWQSVPVTNADDQVRSEGSEGGLSVFTRSAGGALAVQHAWSPVVTSVLLARDVRLGGLPTIAAPDGSVLSIAEAGRAADAVPGQLGGVAVADLESMLRAGSAAGSPDTQAQIWVAPGAIDRLPEVYRVLAEESIPVLGSDTAEQALSGQRYTASALTGRIAPWLAVLAGLFAGLGIALTVITHRSVLGRDLAALRLAGVRESVLRRSVLLTYLVPGLLAVLLGAAAGAWGCALVIGDLPLLPTPTPSIRNQLGLHLVALLGCLVAGLALVVTVVVVSIRRLWPADVAERLRGSR